MMRNRMFILITLLLGILIGVVLHDAVEMTPTEPNQAMTQALPSSGRETGSPQRNMGVTSVGNDPEIYENLIADLEDLRLSNQQQEQWISALQVRVHNLEENAAENLSSVMIERPEDTHTAVPDSTSEPSAEASLIAAGIDSQLASWIQQQLDKIGMDKLYLKNTALREGWMNTKRYRKSLRELKGRFDALRGEIGDDNFDRLLYAAGRHNRVFVSSTMSGSPAEQFGLNSGDSILSYDGKRIFSRAELQRLASKGDTASMISVEVIRDGSPMNLYLPGGPLGIRMTSRRVKP